MKCHSYLYLFATVCGFFLFQYNNAFPNSKYIQSDDNEIAPQVQSRIEPITMALASALVPVALNFFTGFITNMFNKPTDTEQRVIYGRPMQVKTCGAENCIQLLDKGSGFTTVGKGDNMQHALGDAMQAMFNQLLQRKLLSFHDLCREHIHFPHPDQERCAGVEINTCELSKPTLPQPACMDSHGTAYCKKMQSHCADSLYATFMMSNCYKTCTNDCYKASPGVCDIPPM